MATRTALADSLKGAEPPAKSEARTKLEEHIKEIAADLQSILQPDKKATLSLSAVTLVENLQKLLVDAENRCEEAKNSVKGSDKAPEWLGLIAELQRFCQELRHWRAAILTSAGTSTDVVRSRFDDEGRWATHYSTVRMTVSTFFIATAWGVVSVKWNEYSDGLALAALVVWFLAGYLLWTFTWATWKACERQQEYRFLLPVPSEKPPTRKLSGRFVLSMWSPALVYLPVSILFIFLIAAWALHQPPSDTKLMAVVQEASIEKGSKELQGLRHTSRGQSWVGCITNKLTKGLGLSDKTDTAPFGRNSATVPPPTASSLPASGGISASRSTPFSPTPAPTARESSTASPP